ncbi:MAG: hypothetical protein NTW07_06280 [candidate division Zixibacteria bacterium]|nr:hypothetical protein [candidate division Zixibacteria bacterium]
MDYTTFLWTTAGAFLTLSIFSFLYKDNPFYKFAEHLFAGISAGYFGMILWHNGLIPKLMYDRLDDGNWYFLWLDSSKPWYLIPALLGILMWSRFSKKYQWVSRFPLAMYIGIGAGIAIPLEMRARVNEQLSAMMRSINWSHFFGTNGFNLLDTMSGLSQLIVFIGAICGLVYFFFSKAHTGVFGSMAKFGIWILMIGFGASFGYTVMARVSLFINRMQFLDQRWIKSAIAPSAPWWYELVLYLVVAVVIAYAAWELAMFLRRKKNPETDQVA